MRGRDFFSTFRGHRVPNVNFIGRKTWWFSLSGAFVLLSLIGLFARGLNYSIDFKGGSQLEFPNRSGASELVSRVDRTVARSTFKPDSSSSRTMPALLMSTSSRAKVFLITSRKAWMLSAEVTSSG